MIINFLTSRISTRGLFPLWSTIHALTTQPGSKK